MTQTVLLKDLWYVALPGQQLKKGKTQTAMVAGHKILFGRTNENEVFALKDFCPHRGVPLSYGTFDGNEIECCYHGWCFNSKGACTKIPSLTPDSNVDITRIKAGNFPCREVDGNIWVFIPKGRVPENLPEIPAQPVKLEHGFYWVDSVNMPCNIDHAVIGLMDPAHGPYVHKSWWWRTQKSMHLKQKDFAPAEMGFKMVSHKPSTNSRAYKILGGSGERKTEISFRLPSLRTEFITIGEKHIVLLTALTPVDESNTMLHQFFYSNIPLLNMLLPLARPFGKKFIQQDLDMVKKQQEGLRDNPSLMLIGDADAQALWYFKLKKDYLESQEQSLPFENRIKAKTLRWKS